MSRALCQGRIVWVELTDPQGRGPKVRPAVVLTPTAAIASAGTIVVAAISSQIGMAPPERTVPLPWHRDRKQSRTGLTEESEVICDWLRELPVAAVRGTSGVVPTNQLMQIIGKVHELMQSDPTPDDRGGSPREQPPAEE
jgi:mRNA-degrading endonuclease toxin of MazEF toxin-antitoxin module